MTERLISPSKVTAWLACVHTLTLDHRRTSGSLKLEDQGLGEMAAMLLDKGESHELDVLARYEAEGKKVFVVPTRITPQNPAPADADGRTSQDFPGGWEPFDAWVARVGNPMATGEWDVVYQLPLVHDGVRGVADFLVRVDGSPDATPPNAPPVYEAVDAKLTRLDAKPGHVLQLCFYADAVLGLTGQRADTVALELGSGECERIRLADVEPYWQRLRNRLAGAMADAPTATTEPVPCSHCDFCDYAAVCNSHWRDADSLVFVGGLRSADREVLVEQGVSTMTSLAAADPSLDLGIVSVDRHVRQADLQVRTADLGEDATPLVEVIVNTEPALPIATNGTDDAVDTEPTGFAAMPEPSPGDVFLDFEGHPFWTADSGLFFLFGLIERTEESLAGSASVTAEDSDWQFVQWWAHDVDEERDATVALVEYLAERRERFGDMHVYHYNHTERSSLQRLTQHHGVAELELEALVAEGRFIDLFPIVTGAVQIGIESYGLKQVESVTGFVRSKTIIKGSGAVVEYERWMREPDAAVKQSHLDAIGKYNEDDVRATRAVRDWLVEQRPDIEWRAAVLEPFERDEEVDLIIRRLHDFDPGTPQHLLGDLLGYWRREDAATYAEAGRQLRQSTADLLDDAGSIGQLTAVGVVERLGKNGKPITAGYEFEFPPQELTYDLINAECDVAFAVDDQTIRIVSVVEVDPDAGRLVVVWNADRAEEAVVPSAVCEFSMFTPRAKLDALRELATDVLAGHLDSAPARFLFERAPQFTHGPDPVVDGFEPGVEAVIDWATRMNRTVVPIQGPPGAGKTYVGSHTVRALVSTGLRVGVCAMGHSAIDNLMHAVVDVFDEAGDTGLRAIKQGGKDRTFEDRDDFEYRNIAAKHIEECNVFAGTAWLFASEKMREQPVDVLFIDEAGQLGMADMLAASMGAKSVILLGDPQQLPQVSKASHPGGADRSALQHVLGDDQTMPADCGVFLDTTWRMHPDVNGFISDVMYDGQLGTHPSCSTQATLAGTGLRWIRAEHAACSRSSQVEADLIAAEIIGLMGTDWTDSNGNVAPLTPDDFIVVAPYNDQRRLIDDVLDSDARTRGVPVGTVDKFQGQEAAVVFFSMTTSSSAHMPRTADFLFSKNRLNVAISRARCVAYLVCTEQLLDTTAKSVTQMQQIGALCAFVERAG
ncbi:MAG: putative RecB family nuclease [Ilumatobacter sp.]|jgi:predicted RecB family nuclease